MPLSFLTCVRKYISVDRTDLLHGFLVLAVFAVGVSQAFLRSPDPLIDFGSELYVPWRLIEGDILYRDVLTFKGPLSPWINVFWFRLFGVGLHSILIGNTLLLLALTFLVWNLVRRCSDRPTATLATIGMLITSGIAQFSQIGLFNFLTPFVHELTHGTLLLFVVLFVMTTPHWEERRSSWMCIGIFGGLALLTRSEIALAIIGTTGWGICIKILHGGKSWVCRHARSLGLSISAMFVVLFCAWLLLCRNLSPSESAHALLTPFRVLFFTDVSQTPFFQKLTGFDRPLFRIQQILQHASYMLLWAIAAILVSAPLCMPFRRKILRLPLSMMGLLFAGGTMWITQSSPLVAGRAGTLVVLGVFLWSIARLSEAKNTNSDDRFRNINLLCVAALLMLLKIILRPHVGFYGFVHALPSFLVTVIFLGYLFPSMIVSKGSVRDTLVLSFRAMIAIELVYLAALSFVWFSFKNTSLGTGADTLYLQDAYVDERTPVILHVLRVIEERLGPEDTFVTIPEGVMLNYLSRRRSSIPVTTYMVTEFSIFGAERIERDFKISPPTAVLLIERKTDAFGCPYFGACPWYGQSLLAWIREHYAPVWSEGARPFTGSGFGMELLMQKENLD